MVAPLSSYSFLVIQHDSNVEIAESIEPPIQTANFLSGDAITLISSLIQSGAKALISLVSLSGKPLNIVFPPDKTMQLYIYFLISISQLRITS